MKKPFYGWFVCIGCALVLFCTSGLMVNAFTVYQPYIISLNGFTNTQGSSILTVRSLFSFLSMFLSALYYKKLSYRVGLALAGLLTASGFLLFGLAHSLLSYYAAAMVVGLAYGVGTMIPITIILGRWFIRKRTLAIGICSASTGLSTLGIPSAITALIERFGLRAAFLSEAALIAAFACISFLLVRSTPAQVGLKPLGEDDEDLPDEKLPVSGTGSLRRRSWILLWPMLLLLGALTSTGYSHLSVLSNCLSFSPHVTALAITASGIALTLGKLLYGWLADRITIYRCNWLFGGLITAGLILLCLCRGNTVLLFAGMLLYGLGLAMMTVGLSAWAGDLSSAEQYENTVRLFQIGYSGGGLLSSSIPGILADRFGGSYVPAYIMFACFAAFVTLSIQWIYKKRSGAASK